MEAAAQREEQSSCVSGQVSRAQEEGQGVMGGGQGLCLHGRNERGVCACWLEQITEALGGWTVHFNLNTARRRS